MRGQDDRKRERHARDGVWLPAGEEHPGTRGSPDSRHTPTARGQGGRAFCPLAAPPTAGWQIAQADQGGTGPAVTEHERNRTNQCPDAIHSALVDASSTLNPWPQMIHLLRQQTGGQARILRIHLQAGVAK